MVTEQQKKCAQAIVNIFETGQVEGDYGKVTLLPNDPGHLTYGRSQTTLTSGNLYLLAKAYAETTGSEYASEFEAYLSRLANRDTSLDYDTRLRGLLRDAGNDPVMHEVQDEFFDRVYWNPSLQAAEIVGISTGLGTAVVYDSKIHGSWVRMRDETTNRYGLPKDVGEKSWVESYVAVRREWLANHSIEILRRTVYRMDSFGKLIAEAKWGLELPIYVRGIKIDEERLGERPIRVSAQDVEERLLSLKRPYMQGEDVRKVQEKLKSAGLSLEVDGIFGPGTDEAVREFQKASKLKVDGIVGQATLGALGL
jgi:chitosanase